MTGRPPVRGTVGSAGSSAGTSGSSATWWIASLVGSDPGRGRSRRQTDGASTRAPRQAMPSLAAQSAQTTHPSTSGGVTRRARRLQTPGNRPVSAPDQGLATGPRTPRPAARADAPGRDLRSTRSAVGVARAAALDPQPALAPGRAARARRRRPRATVSSPSSSSSRATSAGAISRSWVAHAVESVRTTSRPSTYDSGVACSATSSPTIADQRAKTPCTRRSVPQPRVADQPLDARVHALRVPLVGVRAGVARPDARTPHQVGRPARPAAASAAPRRGRRCARRAHGRPPWPGRARVAVRPAAPRPARRAARRSRLLRLTRRGSAVAVGRRRTGAPCSAAGTSSATAAVTSTCSAPATRSASCRGARRRARRRRRRAPASGRRRRRAADRTTPAGARARTTTTHRGWRSPSPAGRQAQHAGRRGADRPG